MADNNDFATVLKKFVEGDLRSARKIAEASEQRFGADGKVSHGTISRWLRGETKAPQQWEPLIKLAIVLGLREGEANELLYAANYANIAKLREDAEKNEDKKLLSHWDQSKSALGPLAPPRDLAHFIEREAGEATLKALKKQILLKKGIFCIEGMAGVGKTSLAIFMAHQLHHYFPDGVLWAELNRSEPMSILYAFADAYGVDVSGYTDLATRSSKVRSILAEKEALIILDDVERDEQIRDLLPPTESSAVLITTRQHDLSVADEATCLPLKPFSPQESLALFAGILGEARTKGWERSDLRKIAELLGHLPLAIAIVANQLKKEPNSFASSFLAKLRRRQQPLDLLARGRQNVRLSFEISYQALPSELQLFFTALGIFEGEDFSVEASAYVAGYELEEGEDYLSQLYNLSLIQLGRAQRYKLHPLLRRYSQEQTPSPAYFERLVTYFVDYIVAHAKEYNLLEPELGNILAALDLAHQQEMKAALVRGVTALFSFLEARGLYQQAESYLIRAKQAARESNDLDGLVLALSNLGHLANKQGPSKQGQVLYQEALALARQTENTRQIGSLLTSLGALAYRLGELEQAKQYYEQGIDIAQQADDQSRIVALLINLGLIAARQGSYEYAASQYQQALRLTDKVDVPKRTIITLHQNLGDLMLKRRDYEQARTYCEKGLTLAEESGAPELSSRLLGNLGLAICGLGEYSQASDLFKQGLALAKKNQLTPQISRQLANLGKLATCQKSYQEANFYYKEALDYAQQKGFIVDKCMIQNLRGECYLAQKNFTLAEQAFGDALEIARKLKMQPEEAKSLQGLARIAAEQGTYADNRPKK